MSELIETKDSVRKASVCRRFHLVTPIALDGYCEILESMETRNVHRIAKNKARFQLTPPQAHCLAKFYRLNAWPCYFAEKPLKEDTATKQYTAEELVLELKRETAE